MHFKVPPIWPKNSHNNIGSIIGIMVNSYNTKNSQNLVDLMSDLISEESTQFQEFRKTVKFHFAHSSQITHGISARIQGRVDPVAKKTYDDLTWQSNGTS